MELSLWHLTLANKTVHIMGIYHPSGNISNKSTMNLFFEELSDYLTENINKHEELIILGDTNINYDLKTDNYTVAFEEVLYSFGLQQLINCPTHISGHCVDHIIIKNRSKLETSELNTVWQISDHWATIL